ncbi:hypothetical protein AAGG74_18655 [Bacillus mexicanus]|uniref:hypothetical protein n=1 Tax=Bacillus mexicanus TaxID=2834415 RepID=UPI003D214C5D
MRIVNDMAGATRWIAGKDKNIELAMITIGKPYEIHWDEIEKEHYIVDDEGNDSLVFLALEGILVSLK